MESPVRTFTLLVNKDTGYGTLMENDEIVRKDIPEYELKAFVEG